MTTVALSCHDGEQEECAGQMKSSRWSNCRNCCWLTLEKKHWWELFLAAFVFTPKRQLLNGTKSPVMLCNVKRSSVFWRNYQLLRCHRSCALLSAFFKLWKYCKSSNLGVLVWNSAWSEACSAKAVLFLCVFALMARGEGKGVFRVIGFLLSVV